LRFTRYCSPSAAVASHFDFKEASWMKQDYVGDDFDSPSVVQNKLIIPHLGTKKYKFSIYRDFVYSVVYNHFIFFFKVMLLSHPNRDFPNQSESVVKFIDDTCIRLEGIVSHWN
jgi:hypothetical protein